MPSHDERDIGLPTTGYNHFMNAFAHLKASPHAGSIYYADLFVIKGKGWMIGGCGKSEAGQIATDYGRRGECPARDAVALVREAGTLCGRYDPGAINHDSAKVDPLLKIDVIAYCLRPEDTEAAFPGKPLALSEFEAKHLAYLLSQDPSPVEFLGQHFFSQDELRSLQNPARRYETFLELTDGIPDLKFLIVPFMPSVQDKAALYTSYLP